MRHRSPALRQLTVALPPQYAARLFDAQQQGGVPLARPGGQGPLSVLSQESSRTS
ncbi:hypothetical protein ACIQTN_30600 [Streptomyces werraensis]|uniref:hypothetical protein n=1 Tax=Streptomyces werraensis TaxID=68284 RepID=UPI00381888C2